MNKFDIAYDHYEAEVKERYGQTVAYKEHSEKTACYSKEKWQQVNDGLNLIFAKFADCMKGEKAPGSEEAQALVDELRCYITENYYTCHKEILKGLGQMYVSDERFKKNIDKHVVGTAQYTSKAIELYCK